MEHLLKCVFSFELFYSVNLIKFSISYKYLLEVCQLTLFSHTYDSVHLILIKFSIIYIYFKFVETLIKKISSQDLI